MIAYDKLIKVLDYNMVCSQRLPNDKKFDDQIHFPGESSHVKAEKNCLTVPNHCLICAFISSKLNSCG